MQLQIKSAAQLKTLAPEKKMKGVNSQLKTLALEKKMKGVNITADS